MPQNIDISKLQSFLNGRYIIKDDETFFKDIKSLKPAHYLLIKNNEFNISKYWGLSAKETSELKDTEYNQKFLALLKLSIKRRLRSDVRVGASLSEGGRFFCDCFNS